MVERPHPRISLRLLAIGIVASLVIACHRNTTAPAPVTLQRSAVDGSVTKAVPVRRDEREKDAQERLLASIDCVPYEVLDLGTYTSALSVPQPGEAYYLWVKYRCAEKPQG
jgi:hypothetical protein